MKNPEKKRVHVRIGRSLYEESTRRARELEMDFSEYVSALIRADTGIQQLNPSNQKPPMPQVTKPAKKQSTKPTP